MTEDVPGVLEEFIPNNNLFEACRSFSARSYPPPSSGGPQPTMVNDPKLLCVAAPLPLIAPG